VQQKEAIAEADHERNIATEPQKIPENRAHLRHAELVSAEVAAAAADFVPVPAPARTLGGVTGDEGSAVVDFAASVASISSAVAVVVAAEASVAGVVAADAGCSEVAAAAAAAVELLPRAETEGEEAPPLLPPLLLAHDLMASSTTSLRVSLHWLLHFGCRRERKWSAVKQETG